MQRREKVFMYLCINQLAREGYADLSDMMVSGASAPALEMLERGMHELRVISTTRSPTMDSALAASTATGDGPCSEGVPAPYGNRNGGCPWHAPPAGGRRALPASARERHHLQAIDHLADGRWRAAGGCWKT